MTRHERDRDFLFKRLLSADELRVLTAVVDLSYRYRAVFVLLGQGNRPKQLAGILDIATTTVETHIDRMRNKLGHTNKPKTADLVFLAKLWVRASAV